MAQSRQTKNAYARGRRAAQMFKIGSANNRGNPYNGDLNHPERKAHEAWARAYLREHLGKTKKIVAPKNRA